MLVHFLFFSNLLVKQIGLNGSFNQIKIVICKLWEKREIRETSDLRNPLTGNETRGDIC